MNFAKAYECLIEGKKIRRKEWEPFMHMRLIDDKVKTYRGEYTNFYADASVLTSNGWYVVDGDGSGLIFIEALEELKMKKSVSNTKWNGKQFIFVDKDQIASCREVEYDFMPDYKSLCANDWEILK
jgi:hypothetical protein